MQIPYSKQNIDNKDRKAVNKVLSSKLITQGSETENFEKKITEFVGSKYALTLNSGTSALHTALILADVEEPIGFHHNDTTINYNKDNQHTTENGNQGDGVDRTFNTSSDYNISWVYNTTNRLIASYTSSWINEALAPSYNNTQQQTWKFIIQDADVEHSPSGETGREIIGSLSDADNYIAVSASNDCAAFAITPIFIKDLTTSAVFSAILFARS